MNDTVLVIVLVFGAVAMIAFFISRLLVGSGGDNRLRDRLTAKQTADPAQQLQQDRPQSSGGGMAPMLQKMGQAAAKPFMPNTREKQSSLRKQLGFAGIYSPNAVKVVTGFKVILLAGGLIGGYIIGLSTGMMLMGLSI